MRGNHAIARINLDNTSITSQGLLAHLAPVLDARRTVETPLPPLQFSVVGTPAADDENAMAQLTRTSKSPIGEAPLNDLTTAQPQPVAVN